MTSFDDIDIETTKISLDDLAEVLSAIANKSRDLAIDISWLYLIANREMSTTHAKAICVKKKFMFEGSMY